MTAILKYNAGNVTSVENALRRLGEEVMVTDNADLLRRADRVIFPGVGEASSAMKFLKERNLDEVIRSLRQPVLGICLGMQLLCSHSEEGDVQGIGIFDTLVKKFPPLGVVPHTGWNNFTKINGKLFDGISTESNFYFVHSYYAEICENTCSTTDYIVDFSSALAKNNFYAVQFHPEKSAENGVKLLKNFLTL